MALSSNIDTVVADAEESADEVRIEEEWYQALFEEDSNRLMKLLRKNTSRRLWTLGWEREPGRSEDGRRRDSRSDETQGQWKGRTALHVGARRGCVKLLRTLCEDEGIESQYLTKLLKSKDGTYEVDAIAMGVVNGNPDVVSVLLKAGLKCYEVKSKYSIQKLEKTLSVAEEENERYRDEIKSITRRIIDKYKVDPLFQEAVLGGYNRHLDFNFLPREEYLFHFLCTKNIHALSFSLETSLETVMETTVERMEKIERKFEMMKDRISTEMAGMASEMPNLLEFWWTLKDGQGRSPLHVAVDDDRSGHHDHGSIRRVVRRLIDLCFLVDEETVKRIIHCRDGAGRTAVHRAMDVGVGSSGLEEVWYFDDGLDWVPPVVRSNDRWGRALKVAAEEFRNCLQMEESKPDSRSSWTSRAGTEEYLIDVHSLSKENGFDDVLWLGQAPIHSVIRWSNKEMCSKILKLIEQKGKLSYFDRYVTTILPDVKGDSSSAQTVRRQSSIKRRHVDIIGFAALFLEKATDPIFDIILDFNKEKNIGAKEENRQMYIPTVALLAARGKYHLLQSSIDAKLDPLEEDHMESTALHYVFQGKNIPFKYHMDLLSFCNCHQIKMFKSSKEGSKDMKAESSPYEEVLKYNTPLEKVFSKSMDQTNIDRAEKNRLEKDFVEVQGCINLLIQQGCDIFKPNNRGQIPYPNKDADPKLFSWWHEKKAKEFAAAQTAQSAAANAISVTAALVATASYVGPLQPPLGYSDNDPPQLRLDVFAVKIFIICDTMSFYLAITAIILALVPCLPMPQQPMDAELRRTRRMVNAAVTVLFPSIICVLLAFAAGSIAVVQANHGSLAISTASIGGFCCIIAIFIFTIRWLRIICHRSTRINKLYVATSF